MMDENKCLLDNLHANKQMTNAHVLYEVKNQQREICSDPSFPLTCTIRSFENKYLMLELD